MLCKSAWQVTEKPIRGLNTAWLEAGTRGRPVVFLCHGFPDDPHAWSQQIDQLQKSYHIIAPYVRGCDRSEAADELRRYGSEAVLLDHLAILEACDVSAETPVTAVGHDLGAVHALNLARALGSRLAAVVIINGGDVGFFARRLKRPRQVARSWYMGLMQVPLLPEALVKFAPKSCAWLAGEIGGLAPELREDKDFERRTLAPLNQYRAFAQEISQGLKKRQPRIAAPILVLWGKNDGFLEPPDRQEWQKVGLSVTIRILKGGHWLHREDPDIVNELLTEFIVKALARGKNNESNAKLGLSH